MNKFTIFSAFFLATAAAGLAQSPATESELLTKLKDIPTAPASTPAPAAPLRTRTAEEVQKATEIVATKEATFNNENQTAVFIGNVQVKDPQFTLTADKLTAFLRKGVPKDEAANGSASAKASPSAEAGSPKKEAPKGGGGLGRAVAEGHVLIVQEKPDADGKGITRYVGKAERAEYDAVSGEVRLIGNPQVQEGINLHLATDPSTIMILHRDARSMKTVGPSRTVISDKGPETPEKK